MQQLELPFDVTPPLFTIGQNPNFPLYKPESEMQKIEIRESNGKPLGVKHDKQKVRPTLLFKSLKQPLDEVMAVLEFGARKYAPDNWKHVEGHRYDDAMLRHIQAYLGGEMNDPETGLHHLAHATCCILFKIYLDKNPK
jgi:hypothetical protein